MRILLIAAMAVVFSAAPLAAQTLEERIEALKSEILELHGEVASTVTALEDDITALEDEIAALEAQLADLKDQLPALEAQLAERQADLQRLQEAADALGAEPTDEEPTDEEPDLPEATEADFIAGDFPQEAWVRVEVADKPDSVFLAEIVMEVFDPDFPAEGELLVDGDPERRVELFGDQASKDTDGEWHERSYTTPVEWWGGSEPQAVLFRHLESGGYRVRNVRVRFAAAPPPPPPPPPPPGE